MTTADPQRQPAGVPVGVLAEITQALPSLAGALDAADIAWRTVSDSDATGAEITTLVIGGGPFDAASMDNFPNLDLVVRAGIGLDLVDLTAAEKRGIRVVNTPGYGTQEVADQALLLLLTITRRLHHFEQQAEGAWSDASCAGVPRLADLTLGVIGLGAIGTALSRRARACGMNVIAHDPYVTPDVFAHHEVAASSLEALLETSDVISLHAPLTDETHHLLHAQTFRQMQRRPVIINTARGGLINTTHLIEALDSGQVAAAGLDVVEGEPAPPTELMKRENVVVTPHVGWYSEGSRDEMGRLAAAAVIHGGLGRD